MSTALPPQEQYDTKLFVSVTKQSRLVVASQSLNKLASVNDRTQVPSTDIHIFTVGQTFVLFVYAWELATNWSR